MGHALPVTEMRFAQPLVDHHRQPGPLAECDRGVQRPLQVGGHDEQRLPLGQYFRGRRSLLAAQVAQLGVELALHSAACVVLGLPVPQHDKAADPHTEDSPGSSSTDSTGQSRHKRSRA
jgi:hypothetical protein